MPSGNAPTDRPRTGVPAPGDCWLPDAAVEPAGKRLRPISPSGPRGRLFDHHDPNRLVLSCLLLFAAVWLVHVSYSSLSPPTDNIEQLNWVRSLEWGYYKHPPLPTWLFWLAAQILGAHVWTSYLMATALNLVSLYVFWRLVARLRGHRYATVALLGVLCISYYNMRLHAYNHNTVLMFFSTVSAALCWRAFASGRQRWWAALGVALGLGMLTKYQMAVTVASVIVFWTSQYGWRDPRHRRGLLLSALVALLITVPHMQWLRTHDFGPIEYALESSLGANLGLVQRVAELSNWLADQMLNRALAAWLLLAALLYIMRRGSRPGPPSLPAQSDPSYDGAGRALILAWGLVPLLFIALVGLGTGALLQMRWGSPFLLFAVPVVMDLSDRRGQWRRVPLGPALAMFVAFQVLLLLWSYSTSARGPVALRDPYWRNFDNGALARALEGPARAALHGGRICVVAGPTALAGALALQLPDRPLVLIDGRYDRSPWVSMDLVKRCGILQVERDAPLPGGIPVGPLFPGLSWRVILPQPTPVSNTIRGKSTTTTTTLRTS